MATNNSINNVITAADFTITAGNDIITAGNLTLPSTNAGGTAGCLIWNSITWMHTSGTDTVYIGNNAGKLNPSNANTGNVGIGTNALKNCDTTNGGNVAIGYDSAGNANADWTYNVAIGSHCLRSAGAGTTENVYLGQEAGYTLSSHKAVQNVVIGYQAHYTANGADNGYNVLVGYRAGYSFTGSESSNIIIGYGIGTAGDNNTIRIGKPGTTGTGEISKTYIAGIYNIAVGATAGVVLCDSVHKLGTLSGSTGTVLVGGTAPTFTASPTLTTVNATTFDTNVAAAGVTLAGTTLAADGSDSNIDITITPKGTGTIVSAAVYAKDIAGGTLRDLYVDSTGLIGYNSSSMRYKDNIQDMADESNFIHNLRPVTFSYKKDPDSKKQYGLIAEEVESVNPIMVSYNNDKLPETVSYYMLAPLLLNEVKKLYDRIDALEANLKEK